MKNYLPVFLSAVLFFSCSNSITSVNTKESFTGTDSVWTFKPAFMNPHFGSPSAVTGDYAVSYRPHELKVYLPYYGQAYSNADVLSGSNPLNFTSVDFEEVHKTLKKGRLEILFRPRDYSAVTQMRFTIYPGGNSYADITLSGRSGIHFTGAMIE